MGSSVPRSEGNTIVDFLSALILELEKWLNEWLRALAALAEDKDSILVTYMADHNLLQLQSQGFQCPLLVSSDNRHTCGT